jgi:hypothetical protein
MNKTSDRILRDETAVDAYRDLLRDMAGEVADATATLPAGYQRLCAGLESFWESVRERRDELRPVAESAGGAELLGRIGRPFQHLLYSELINSGCENPVSQLSPLIEDVRSIARAELRSGRRARQRRRQLLERVGEHCRA